jgi:ubiquinone/menaquinone biosynthesis C-methylase UbiE
MESYAQKLNAADPLREPILRDAVQALHLLPGTRGLDVGCGLGLPALLLAEAVGPAGHVTGLDVSRTLLDQAADQAAGAGLSDRISFRQGDWQALPFDDATFDWLWSADAVGCAPGDRAAEIKELVRVVKPGGLVAILFWSSQMLLPGYPALEARLDGTAAGTAPFVAGMLPELHPLRSLGWLRAAGLEAIRVETLARTLSAPLDDGLRAALLALLEMRWAEAEMSQADRALYRRLCQAASPELILDRPDYCAFFTYTLFCGQVPGSAGEHRH